MVDRRNDVFTLEHAEELIAGTSGSVDRLTEILAQDDTDVVPNTPAAGSSVFSGSGHQKYVSSDTNAYNTGRLTLPATGPLTVSTVMQTIPGMGATLAAGNYRVHAQLLINNPGTAGQGFLSFRLHPSAGLTASSGRASVVEFGATGTVDVADYATLDTTLTGGVAPGTGGLNRVAWFDGYFVFSVGGSLAVQISQAATAAVSIIQNGSYLEVSPVT